MDNSFELALEIAIKAHKGQKDKAGKPYILHVLRVTMTVDTIEEKIVALLHDVIEDSDMTSVELEKHGFPEEIVTAVNILSKSNNISYENYISLIKENSLARTVKIADLKDNMNINRLDIISENDKLRTKKYSKALEILISKT